jgi:hypothetical protein
MAGFLLYFQVQKMANRCCSAFLWLFGVGLFVTSVVFDWINFVELRKNDEEIESTGKKPCDFALNKYHWIFMASVISKMFFGILEYIFSALSLCEQNDDNSMMDTISLFFNVITTICQALDLLLLVLFSYFCLDDDQIHHVKAFISDAKDDFLAGVLGTAGIIFNLAIKKNILTVFKSICCSNHSGKCHKRLSCTSLFFVLVCIGLAIALLLKIL